MALRLGKLPNFRFLRPNRHGHSALDVLQSEYPDRLGERILSRAPSCRWVVSPGGPSLHGSGDDCLACSDRPRLRCPELENLRI